MLDQVDYKAPQKSNTRSGRRFIHDLSVASNNLHPSNFCFISPETTGPFDIDEEPVRNWIIDKDSFDTWVVTFVYQPKPKDTLESHFESLVSEWHEQRSFASSVSDITGCAAYQEIIKLGYKVLPLIFERLRAEKNDPDFWFWALKEITGANPVKPKDRGNMKKMAEAWISWAENNESKQKNLPLIS